MTTSGGVGMDMRRVARIRRVAVVAIVAALVLALFAPAASAGTGARRTLLKATNTTRVTRELRRLDLHARLSELARRHSLRMARQDRLFHTNGPSYYGLGRGAWSWWGENVGFTSGGARDVHRAFMRSAPHRANILRPGFRRVAIGAVRVDGVLWVTEFFYQP